MVLTKAKETKAEIEGSMNNISDELNKTTCEYVLKENRFNKVKKDEGRLDFNLVILDFEFWKKR